MFAWLASVLPEADYKLAKAHVLNILTQAALYHDLDKRVVERLREHVTSGLSAHAMPTGRCETPRCRVADADDGPRSAAACRRSGSSVVPGQGTRPQSRVLAHESAVGCWRAPRLPKQHCPATIPRFYAACKQDRTASLRLRVFRTCPSSTSKGT
ncbi:MAG: hypothetical protein JF606_27880 [Burkholderiales bacterium]|nr:hypothetical protein [Burkholderiales bacterium]